MLTVSETDLGTPEAVWLATRALRDLPSLAVEPTHLVVVAPHPDDEILGAGGLMLAAQRFGAAITVVAVTDGEASHPRSAWTGPRLASRRRAESRDAFERLGIRVADVVRCALPDGEVAAHQQRLIDVLRDVVGRETLVATTWRHDGHPDHDATGRAAAAVAAPVGATLLEHPIWAWHWTTPRAGLPLEHGHRLDLDASDRSAKRRAIAAFGSQIRPLGPGPEGQAILPPAVRARFERTFEVHLREADDVTRDDGRSAGSTTVDYFDRMYEDPDPWGYESSWYEQRKYALTIASLPNLRYPRAFEPGCSIGVLTEQLAGRCDELVSWDFHGATAQRARERVALFPHVAVADDSVPDEWPAGAFDLIVLSEVAYYLDDQRLDLLVERVAATTRVGGDVVLVHWRGETDYPQTGDAVHDRWRDDTRFEHVVEHREDAFRLDVIRRRPDSP